ncbi:MAG TPA: S46 family peptidase, partial [Bryobacteraceae bacterium]
MGHKSLRYALAIVSLGAFWAARSDEGMWTFDNPPLKLLQQKYGFTPTQAWLDHIRLSCVRLNDGGSGSFVSPHGLLLTNHHVARGQLQKNSTKEHDYIRDGFYAPTSADEMKSPDLEINVLQSMENVTARVTAALQGAKSTEEEFARRKGVMAEIERESLQKTGLRSDIVTLYQGGEYWLYRYKKYTDVRIVFAPEAQAAFFGGDPDNFTYPRHDIDMALFRVYENGKPIDSKDYLKWNPKGAGNDELTFVAGHPGSTSRLDTLAQLELERDTVEPNVLKLLNHRVAVLRTYSALGPEQSREAASDIFGLENSIKAYDGRLKGLLDKSVMDKKRQDEEAFRAAVMANATWKSAYGSAWDDIAQAEKKAAPRLKERWFHSTDSRLSLLASNIVQYVAEIKKPDAERLPGFHEAQLESLRYEMLSPAPIYPGLETARMAGQLEQDLAEMGPNDPFMKIILNGRSPKEVADALVKGSKVAD